MMAQPGEFVSMPLKLRWVGRCGVCRVPFVRDLETASQNIEDVLRKAEWKKTLEKGFSSGVEIVFLPFFC